MSEKFNNIRNRIMSVKNTQKITAAMNLVSSAKLFRSQDTIRITHYFSNSLHKFIHNLLKCLDSTETLPLLHKRKNSKNITLCVITSDCGLCGSYNSCVIKLAEAEYKNLSDCNNVDNVEIIVVGRKGAIHFDCDEYNIRAIYECNQNSLAKSSLSISEELLRLYFSGETDSVELIYTRFESPVSSLPCIMTLIPILQFDILQNNSDIFLDIPLKNISFLEKKSHPKIESSDLSSMIKDSEEGLDLIMQKILPLYINGLIYAALCESIASEHSSRMKSMQLACDNANNLLAHLNIEYNHARQTTITKEILEVVSGSAALS